MVNERVTRARGWTMPLGHWMALALLGATGCATDPGTRASPKAAAARRFSSLKSAPHRTTHHHGHR